jgi:SAM-dependent methyltransferase
MHDNAKTELLAFFDQHVWIPSDVLEVGSRDINGNVRDEVKWRGHQYLGLDVVEGPNVDIVSSSPYSFPFTSNWFDVVFSVSTAYCVFDLHRWVKELARLVKTDGYLCLISPGPTKPPTWPIEGVVDLWRLTPAAWAKLFDAAQLKTLSVYGKEMDSIGIAQKR